MIGTGAESLVIQLGSFGLVAIIVINGVRWMPRAVKAIEAMESTLERIEKRLIP
jgi:hypothetical protein